MTDRINGCWVSFDQDIRVDDAEPLLAAIRQLRGVVAVEQKVVDFSDWMAQSRARQELIAKLHQALQPEAKEQP